jgi:membrane-associated phospholipid phosphatase
VCLFHALVGPVKSTRRLAKWLFSVYAIGLAGYLLFPAVGTSKAFPELFAQPIEGPLLTPLNRMVVEQGSSVYDAFPSLHVLITCTLLEYDRRYCRRRFFAILLPALGIFTSALYLRYHYAVDLLAGGALFILAKILFKERTSIGVETGNSDKR